jgi:hypothetical protein
MNPHTTGTLPKIARVKYLLVARIKTLPSGRKKNLSV